MDFDTAEQKRHEDEQRAIENHVLTTGEGTDVDVSEARLDLMKVNIPETTDGNLYRLPDGRIVDAGLTIYKPEEIIKEPEMAYDDWPGDG